MNLQTTLRELEEETGITNIEFLSISLIYEKYEIKRNGEKRLKINEYFIGFVKDMEVTIQEGEISNYKWVTYKDLWVIYIQY